MKIFYLIIIFFLVCSSTAGDKNANQSEGYSANSCLCPTPDADKLESSEGKTKSFGEHIHTVNEIKGIVINENRQLISGAAVQVFETIEEKNWTANILKRGKRLSLCGTTASGEFCFPVLKSGMYILVISAGKEYFLQEKVVILDTADITVSKGLEITVNHGY